MQSAISEVLAGGYVPVQSCSLVTANTDTPWRGGGTNGGKMNLFFSRILRIVSKNSKIWTRQRS